MSTLIRVSTAVDEQIKRLAERTGLSKNTLIQLGIANLESEELIQKVINTYLGGGDES